MNSSIKKIIFASNNPDKLIEVQSALGAGYKVLGLKDIGCTVDIPETAETLQGNASIKSHYVLDNFGFDCFADDTGLEIEALDGRPGVYSARFAGESATYDDNVNKVLSEMSDKENRNAQFRTVISLLLDGKEYFFEGKVEGQILRERTDGGKFGYDPIFQPNGFKESFAQMPLDEKNKISHRGLAVKQLVEFLKK